MNELTKHLSDLKLPYIRENHEAVAQLAARKQWTHVHYLSELAREEANLKKDRLIQRRIHMARFPVIKTLDTFDWSLAQEDQQGPDPEHVSVNLYRRQKQRCLYRWCRNRKKPSGFSPGLSGLSERPHGNVCIRHRCHQQPDRSSTHRTAKAGAEKISEAFFADIRRVGVSPH